MTASDRLAAKRRTYWDDARRLAAMGDERFGDMSAAQWAIVYRAVAEELGRCADAEQAAS